MNRSNGDQIFFKNFIIFCFNNSQEIGCAYNLGRSVFNKNIKIDCDWLLRGRISLNQSSQQAWSVWVNLIVTWINLSLAESEFEFHHPRGGVLCACVHSASATTSIKWYNGVGQHPSAIGQGVKDESETYPSMWRLKWKLQHPFCSCYPFFNF